MTHLISFDIGIKNMAYCYAIINDSSKELLLKDLNNIDLSVPKICSSRTLIDYTIDFLDDLMLSLNINKNEKIKIFIECQMTSKMKCIQTAIYTYFKMLSKLENIDIDIIYLFPKHKLDVTNKYPDFKLSNDNSNAYKNNKINSILFTSYLLNNHFKNDKFIEIHNKYKKKDDISDAFLMIIYYFNEFIMK